MHSKIFKFFLLECIQGTKVTLVLRVQPGTLFLSMSIKYVSNLFDNLFKDRSLRCKTQTVSTYKIEYI